MATLIGKSGASREILVELNVLGLYLASVSELKPLLDSHMARRASAEIDALAEFAHAEQEYVTASERWYAHVDSVLRARMPEFDKKTRVVEGKIEKIQQDVSSTGSLFRCVFRPARLIERFRAGLEIMRSRRVLTAIRREAALFRQSEEAPLNQCLALLDLHRRRKNEFIQHRLSLLDTQIARLVDIVDNGRLAGALAEQEVMDCLGRLPDGWYVINDVNLRADRWVHFEGSQLLTAQIDHIVVGPGGLFVIETKNWSTAFATSGAYHNPYQQVARSSYLCHRMLKREGFPGKTRSIIATRGALPMKPEKSYVRVLSPDELCRYITWFKPELGSSEIVGVVEYLRRNCRA